MKKLLIVGAVTLSLGMIGTLSHAHSSKAANQTRQALSQCVEVASAYKQQQEDAHKNGNASVPQLQIQTNIKHPFVASCIAAPNSGVLTLKFAATSTNAALAIANGEVVISPWCSKDNGPREACTAQQTGHSSTLDVLYKPTSCKLNKGAVSDIPSDIVNDAIEEIFGGKGILFRNALNCLEVPSGG